MELFGTSHFTALAALAVIGGILICAHRKAHRWPLPLLAFLNLAAFPCNQAVYLWGEYSIPLDLALPFHLCDIAAFLAGFALLLKKPLLAELTYCWGLAGTLQALITPNLSAGPHEALFYSFFIHHGMIVIAALFLPFAMGWRPRPGTFPRILRWNQLYFCTAIGVNFALKTNYGFLSQKPTTPSLLDHLGDWPFYLIWIQVLFSIIIALLLFPFSKRINVWRFHRTNV